MTQINCCDGCQRRLPKHHGIHYAEQEMFVCTESRYRLELEPKVTDTWHQPARKSTEAPFTAEGGR